MMRNSGLRYICRHVYIRIEQANTPFTSAAQKGQVLKMPIAHNDGNYTCDDATLAELEKNRQVVFRYTAPDGVGRSAAAQKEADAAGNPNGSMANIAGICSRERNVAGLMPHPETRPSNPRSAPTTAWSFSAPWSKRSSAPQRQQLDLAIEGHLLGRGAACCAPTGLRRFLDFSEPQCIVFLRLRLSP